MDVLVDLTPLETSRRFHGIGSYVRSLGIALEALGKDERRGLDIRALWKLSGDRTVGPLAYGRDAEAPLYPKSVEWLCSPAKRARPHDAPATAAALPRDAAVRRAARRARPPCAHLPRHPPDRARARIPPRALDLPQALPPADALRYRQARRIIAISKYTADDLVRILGISAGKIDVIPHGVDHGRFRPAKNPEEEAASAAARRRFDVSRAPDFLFLGAADPRKNAPLLVSAFAAAALDGVELVFAGRLTPEHRASIDAAASRVGRPLAMRFLGYRRR